MKRKYTRLEARTIAKEVRHRACDILTECKGEYYRFESSFSEMCDKICKEITNIRFNDIDPLRHVAEDEEPLRYFILCYRTEDRTGEISFESKGFPSRSSIVNGIKSIFPEVSEVVLTNLIEVNEDDYNSYNK
jgi:hypothetical protein